jgi:hypothetical protein
MHACVAALKPAAKDNVTDQQPVGRAGAGEKQVKSLCALKEQLLTVEKGESSGANLLADSKKDRLERSAVAIFGLVSRHDPRRVVVAISLLSERATAHCALFRPADEAEISASLDERLIVDHESDLQRQIQETEGNVLDLLCLFCLFLRLLLGLGVSC